MLTLMLAAALMIPLCSCGTNVEKKIQGTWYFMEDYDSTITFQDGNWYSDSVGGTYTVDGDRIHIVGQDVLDIINMNLTYDKQSDCIYFGEYTLYRF